MAKPLLSVRVDAEILAAVDAFSADMGVTRAESIAVLLARGLGDARLQAAKDSLPINAERVNFSEDAGDPTVDTVANGLAVAHGGVEDVAALQPGQLEVDAQVRELVLKCWGLWAAEDELLLQYPAFVLSEPHTVRARFIAIAKAGEDLGLERGTPRSLTYISARLGGLDATEAERIVRQTNPFTMTSR